MMLKSADSEDPRIICREIIFEVFQPRPIMIIASQLRDRRHNRSLCFKADEKNFLIRQLFKDSY